MLHIIPIQTKDEQKALAEAFGDRFDERALAYLAVEEGESGERKPRGFMQFLLGEDGADVLCLREAADSDDLEAMMILARAAFSFVHRVGIGEVCAEKDAVDAALAAALGMKDEDGGWRLDLVRYFATPCAERAKQNTEAAK